MSKKEFNIDYLNIFNYFDDRKKDHEDVLTRNFLLILKHVPRIRRRFYELVSRQLKSKSSIDKYSDMEILTQVDSETKDIKNTKRKKIVSILISDENKRDYSDNSNIRSDIDEYHHRFDGLIKFKNTYFVIENKPSIKNVRLEQLNLPFNKHKNEICKVLCLLVWPEIFTICNEELNGKKMSDLECNLVKDFLDFTNETKEELSPYNTFRVCKDNGYLIEKRFKSILESNFENYKSHIVSGKVGGVDSIKLETNDYLNEIQLIHNNDNRKYIELMFSVGDVMTKARNLYSNISYSDIKKLEKEGFKLTSAMHFAFRASGVFPIKEYDDITSTSLDKYYDFWTKNKLAQIKRKNFYSYAKMLLNNKIISKRYFDDFKKEMRGKKYNKLNVCPTIRIIYCWSKKDALRLDDNDKFVEDLINKIYIVLKTLKIEQYLKTVNIET